MGSKLLPSSNVCSGKYCCKLLPPAILEFRRAVKPLCCCVAVLPALGKKTPQWCNRTEKERLEEPTVRHWSRPTRRGGKLAVHHHATTRSGRPAVVVGDCRCATSRGAGLKSGDVSRFPAHRSFFTGLTTCPKTRSFQHFLPSLPPFQSMNFYHSSIHSPRPPSHTIADPQPPTSSPLLLLRTRLPLPTAATIDFERFSTLPPDVMRQIMGLLDEEYVGRLACVCKSLRTLANELYPI